MRILPRPRIPSRKAVRRLWRHSKARLTVRRVYYSAELILFVAIYFAVFSGSRLRFIDSFGPRMDAAVSLILLIGFVVIHTVARRRLLPKIERYYAPAPYDERRGHCEPGNRREWTQVHRHRRVAAGDIVVVSHGPDVVATRLFVIENTVREKTLNTTLLTSFAAVSLLLAVIGVYGVMSYTVAQHTREIGIRMALGAQPRSILKLVVGRGLVLVAAGVVIGVLASFGLTRFIENMLFGVTPTDPLTFVIIVALLGFVALLACLVPACARCASIRSWCCVTSDPCLPQSARKRFIRP